MIDTSESNSPSSEVVDAERATRRRLDRALARLAALKPKDLVHPPRSTQSFRGGLPYFERTLELFHQLAGQDLRQIPSEYLKIVADDAEQALNQFEEILNFSGENAANPGEIRGRMITEVRDAYRPMYEDIALIVKALPGQLEHIPRARTGALLVVGLAVLILATAAFAFEYSLYSVFVDKVAGALGGL
ncbi:MAG TPA: hypothetical protein VFB33_11800 [Candidatus Binataceae bacterium]|jgi:hypothetical protein|nr:hypothetical protein [Candidatus Binataceae bacterium]